MAFRVTAWLAAVVTGCAALYFLLMASQRMDYSFVPALLAGMLFFGLAAFLARQGTAWVISLVPGMLTVWCLLESWI